MTDASKKTMLQSFLEILNLKGHHNRITGYGDFAEWGDFAFIGGGSAINGATPSSL